MENDMAPEKAAMMLRRSEREILLQGLGESLEAEEAQAGQGAEQPAADGTMPDEEGESKRGLSDEGEESEKLWRLFLRPLRSARQGARTDGCAS